MAEPLLNSQQQQAVVHGDGPLLIIAGAGTGKTTVITERIKHLVLKKHVSTENILALTFTEKAAKEMEERIDVALPYGYTQTWIATFHAFCDRILRDEGIHIGINTNYHLATETEAIMLLQKNLFKLDLKYFRPLGNPNKFLQGLLQHFARLKDEDITPKQYLEFVSKHVHKKNMTEEEKEEGIKLTELAKAYEKYESIKIAEGVMDFGDLIAYTLLLFRTRKHILKQYQDKFHYLLIDEFQDTNYAQNQLALLLAGEKGNITAVGDDDQAIYRWRGAAISNMIQFRQHFPKAKVISLTQNYRSTAAILDGSYHLIQNNNPDRLEIKEHINKKLISVRKESGEDIQFIHVNKDVDEIEQVIATINTLKKSKKYSFKDFAILVRANDQAMPFINLLEKNKMPYQFLGPGQLFHQEEIKDLIAYLKILYNTEDSSSFYRILALPLFGIPGIDIVRLFTFAKKKNVALLDSLSYLDEIQLSDLAKSKLKFISKMIFDHIGLITKETAGQLLYLFLQDSGYLKKLLRPSSNQEVTAAQNIAKFFDRLKTFETQNEDASVFAVVDWLELSMQLGESPLASTTDWTDNNAINILTVHSSKGLEFPVVFIVNLVTQRFPSRERKEQIPLPRDLIKEVLPEGDFHTQEERRLFYVAMTRAKDLLFLTAANYYGDGKRERKLSPFVSESIGEAAAKLSLSTPTKHTASIIPPSSSSKVVPLQTNGMKQPVTYLSYSQIQTFDICPLHYKLRYLLNIPTPESPAQSFGTVIHATLRDFYSAWLQKKGIEIKNIEALLQKNWTADGYGSKDHEKEAYKHALSLLTKYLTENFSPSSLPLALEVPFQFPISLSLKIGGRIDQVKSLSGDRIEIVDYKTGSTLPDEKELSKNLQLTIYCLAATEIKDFPFHQIPENISLSLHFLEKNKIMTTSRTATQLEKAKAEIIAKAEEIAGSNFACSHSIICQNCEYKMLCKTL